MQSKELPASSLGIAGQFPRNCRPVPKELPASSQGTAGQFPRNGRPPQIPKELGSWPVPKELPTSSQGTAGRPKFPGSCFARNCWQLPRNCWQFPRNCWPP